MSYKEEPVNFNSFANQANEIDIGKIFRFLLMQSKLIIAIMLFVFVISYINYYFSTKKYLVQSLLQYESFNQSIFNPSNSLQMSSSQVDISNLTELYESRTNLLKVITDLKLNIDIKDLDDGENIDITIIADKKNKSSFHEFRFSFSEEGFSLLDKNSDEIETAEYGKQLYFNNFSISINSSNLKEYRPINIFYTKPEEMYNALRTKLVVSDNRSRNSWFSNESLITISYITDDIDLGKDIINYANTIFLNQRIYHETEKSRKVIDFIDKSIKSIENDVEIKKTNLKEFREKNKSIDVSLEIEAIINKIQLLDEALNSLEIEITKAQEVYTSNNPIYLNLINKKKLIQRQKDQVISEIEMMPKEQQEYIDLYNDVEISQSLYKELESRRMSFSILEASTIGDIRVVDEAYLVSLISPKLSSVFIATFISLIIASFIAIIRGFNFLPISNPAEIYDNNVPIPVIGVVPFVKNMLAINEDPRFNTSIESLIVNIKSMQSNLDNKKIITITSPSPSNGKSTISISLSEGLAEIDKKVLLIDNDLKRGKIASNYNLKSITEETFKSLDELTIDKYKVKDNLYVIPRVKGLHSTFQFLYSHEYKNIIESFKDNFDYIIFDTGPILSVADSAILVEKSDINLLVVRHAVNRMNEVKQTIDNFKQINKNIDGIIYNSYAKPQSYYGYYGIYGNYSYQYYAEKYLNDTYEYEKKD